MKKTRITRSDVLYLSISFFVIVVLWIVFNIFNTYATTTITPDLQIQIVPIPGQFDTKTIDKLKKRTKITPNLNTVEAPVASNGAVNPLNDLGPTDIPLNTSAEPTNTPTPTPTPTPNISLPSDTPTPTDTPTP